MSRNPSAANVPARGACAFTFKRGDRSIAFELYSFVPAALSGVLANYARGVSLPSEGVDL